jgi:hypothetical protein
MQTKFTGRNPILQKVTLTFVAFSFFQLAGVGAQSRVQSNQIVVIGQTALVGIGRVRSVDFNHDDLPIAGDPVLHESRFAPKRCGVFDTDLRFTSPLRSRSSIALPAVENFITS